MPRATRSTRSKGTHSNKNGASLPRIENGIEHGDNDVTNATKHKAPAHEYNVNLQPIVVLRRCLDIGAVKTVSRKRTQKKAKDGDVDLVKSESDDNADDICPQEDNDAVKTVPRKRRLKKSRVSDVDLANSESDNVEDTCPQEDDADLKKVQFKGPVPVDEHCSLSGYHVYIDKTTYSKFNVHNAMLNQTNISFNNNKYYLVQLLEHDTKYEYATWFRWGRVGKIAGTNLKHHGANLEAAKAMFKKKFQDKTGNSWDHLVTTWGGDFIKFPNKYDLLQMDYGEDGKGKEKSKMSRKKQQDVASKLDSRVEDVVDLIFNIREFEACMKEMKYDVKKAPLGKLTKKQIKAGYHSLKRIEKLIEGGSKRSAISEACSEFYTRVPHDFGMKVPPLISTNSDLRIKIELLKALSDIQIAIEMINDDDQLGSEVSIKDRHYESLGCKLDPLDVDEIELKTIMDYVANSHGSTHTQYKLTVENAYRIHSEQSSQFKGEIGNKMLLWHGSRLTNWAGILKEGLRIAPPEAPATGYMFGKGIYFTDIVSKSANYCFANHRQPCGFLLLCEVALGNTNDKIHADYDADKLPEGKSSTKGLGKEVPDPKGNISLSCGTVVPLGKPMTLENREDYSLMYNEYIVYDVTQIAPRYLVKVKFDYQTLW